MSGRSSRKTRACRIVQSTMVAFLAGTLNNGVAADFEVADRIPEPASLLLLSGAACLLLRRRRAA